MALELRDQVRTDVTGAPGTPAAAPASRPAPTGEVIVRIRGYGRTFAGRTVLSGIDLDLVEGEMTALLGASGSGKSTMLRALAGQDPAADGHVSVPRERAVAFQDHRLLPWKRVWRNVLIGLPRSARRADAIRALDEVGIAGRADAWPGTLSGGESQRVALARAFIRRPRLLLLDEPFGALDALTRLRMHGLLAQLCAHHQPATLLVTHDVDEAVTLADRILVLRDGRISLDHRAPAAGRSAEHALALRVRLLEELGVHAPHPATPSQES